MSKYIKKPVEIEAIQWTDDNFDDIKSFCSECVEVREPEGIHYLVIPTLEEDHIATLGDYIIKGIKGEFYPCKPDIFNLTYNISSKEFDIKDAQSFYNRMEELKEQSKDIHEEMNQLMEAFYNEYQLFELPIKDVDGKEKYIRVYEPEGRFVYNVKYELGLRVKAQNPLPVENK